MPWENEQHIYLPHHSQLEIKLNMVLLEKDERYA